MVSSKMFQEGSRWMKVDFHLHTKADKEFILPKKYNPNEFVKDYVFKLDKKNIKIGSITNHNKFDFEEFKALKKDAIKKDIFLLPGVELSVNDGSNGIHALIIFDPDKWIDETSNYIEQFLTSAFEGIHNRENENTRCNYNIETLLTKLEEHRRKGRDSFIIMAHIEQNSGFLNGLDGGRIAQLAQNKLFRETILGFQKLCTHDNIQKIKGWYGGNKIPAFTEGSDPKNLEEIGVMGKRNIDGIEQERECYIKIGDYNFNSIKYALKDSINRVSKNFTNFTNNFIKSISFIGGKYDGQKINFSREMNNIIGIRGSGKSAILEILRAVLKIDYGSRASDEEYKKSLIEYTLESGGKAVIELESDGHIYRFEKIHGQESTLYQDDVLINKISIDTLINKPIYFGQKDLSSSGLDFEADLVHRLTGTKLDSIQSKVNEKGKEISYTISDIKKFQDLGDKKEQAQDQINDIEHKLKIFEEKGLKDKLKKEASFAEDIVKLENYLKNIELYLKETRSLIENHNNFFSNFNFDSSENKNIFEKAEKVFGKIGLDFQKIQRAYLTSEQFKKEFEGILKELKSQKKKLEDEFAEIKREIKLPKINLDNFAKYTQELKSLQLNIKDIDEKEKRKNELEKKLMTQIDELKGLWHEEHVLLKSEIAKFNRNSNSLHIELEFLGRRDKFKEFLKIEFRGTGLTNNEYDKIVENYPDFVEIFKKKPELNNILSAISLEKFLSKFNEKMSELFAFRVEDKFTIKYHDKPLKDHSLGQRASALILFLLAQEDSELIIIDQPEDDLDNQTIYEDVIKVLRKLKGKMQFIFATHNANIPVLGDSEQIISCSYNNNKFNAFPASIDNKDIQKQIVDVMEGGKEAFSRRKEIYGGWKNQ